MAQIYTGSPAIGIRIDTLNFTTPTPINNGPSLITNFYLDCDSIPNMKIYDNYYNYYSPSFHLYRGSNLSFLDTNLQCGFVVFNQSLPPVNFLRTDSLNAGYLLNNNSLINWITPNQLVIASHYISSVSNLDYTTGFVNKYIPIRKKYGTEYLYGWIYLTSDFSSNSIYSSTTIHQITKFPKLKVIHDTLACISTYTFLDGFTMNNVFQDTVYDFALPSSITNCDSLVRTRLHANFQNYANNYDTVCFGTAYTFLDGINQVVTTNPTIHFNKFTAQNGCDSIIKTILYVRAKDSSDTTIYLHCLSNYTYPDLISEQNILFDTFHVSHFINQFGCDSLITTNLIVTYDTTIEVVNICKGSSYTFLDATVVSNIQTNIFHVNHFVSMFGCDSLIITNLHVKPTFSQNETINLCSGSNYTFHDGVVLNNIIADTFHTSHLISSFGCDSVITTNLQVNPTYNQNESSSICSGSNYTFHDGVVLNNIIADTFHTSHLLSSFSCDSAITTYLQVNPTYNQNESSSICSGSNYTFHDGVVLNNIIADTFHTSHLISSFGCDSMITTYLHVNPTFSQTESTSLCKGSNYTFLDGVIFSNILSDTSHVSHLVSTFGCDSTMTTNLHIQPTYNQIENINLCFGNNYTFYDGVIFSNIVSDTSHVSHLVSTFGCDSTITTNLHINPIYNQTENINLCSGNNYTFYDGIVFSNIMADTSHASHLVSVSGCDSTMTTNLHINPAFNQTENINLCVGNNYTFHDGIIFSNIISDTSHVSHLVSISGCDSIITTHLHIQPTYNQSENINLCIGNNYTFYDGIVFSNIMADTSHVSHLVSISGCDSIITTILTIATIDTSVTQFGTQLTSNAQNINYQWFDCTNQFILIGDTNQIYVASQNGTYAVILNNGSCIDTSSCYPVNSVSVNDFTKENQILIYPNPTNSILNIEIKNLNISHSNMEATLCNTLGEVLLKEKIKPNGKAQFSVSTLSSGVYYIRCEGYCRKIIKE